MARDTIKNASRINHKPKRSRSRDSETNKGRIAENETKSMINVMDFEASKGRNKQCDRRT